MSFGGGPSAPPPAPPPPPPPSVAPEAPLVGESRGRTRKVQAARSGTSSLRTDLMIVPGVGGLDSDAGGSPLVIPR